MEAYDRLFIDGTWTRPRGAGQIEVVNPHTEQVIATVPDGTPGDMDQAVAAARRAFDDGPWPRLSPIERGAVVARIAKAYAARMDEMAQVITAEMGSPITFSRENQAAVPQRMLAYYADLADTIPWQEERAGLDGPITVLREPVGVVAAIVPWNVPQWVTMTKLAPALIAGCTVVLKPAPETPLDAYLLAEILTEVDDLPPGVVNIVPADREVGEYLASHPDVDKVAFSGSTAAGRRIGSICGQQIKRCSLELGGKSAGIICDDADLDDAVAGLRSAALLNSGQACAAQTRILAPYRRYAEVVDALAYMFLDLDVGDPTDPATEIGPMVAQRQQHRVESYVSQGIQAGARLIAGGLRRPFDRGWYVAPTLFAEVDNDMTIAQDEIFGPVLVVIGYHDDADAVWIANHSRYGLSGTVWTTDTERGMAIARQIRTGTCGINEFRLDLAAPFGGHKDSGVGRELGSEGLHSYIEYKAVSHQGFR